MPKPRGTPHPGDPRKPHPPSFRAMERRIWAASRRRQAPAPVLSRAHDVSDSGSAGVVRSSVPGRRRGDGPDDMATGTQGGRSSGMRWGAWRGSVRQRWMRRRQLLRRANCGCPPARPARGWCRCRARRRACSPPCPTTRTIPGSSSAGSRAPISPTCSTLGGASGRAPALKTCASTTCATASPAARRRWAGA